MKASRVELYINNELVSSHPIYADSISIEKERESGEMFRRTKLNSSFTFVREDYDAIFSASINTPFEVRVYDGSTFLAKGVFEKTDCKFDEDNRICEVKTTSADEYDKILNGKNNEYDLISLAPTIESVILNKRAILQVYVLHDTKITNIIGNMSYEIDTKSDIDVDTITASQLKNTYNFTQIGSGDTAIVISSMPSAFSYLEGKYIGNYIGENSVYLQEDGEYKIAMEKEATEGGGYRYFWVFKDSNNNVVNTTAGGLITPISTMPFLQILPSPSMWGVQFGYKRYVEEGYTPWEADFNMKSHLDERNVFARILMNTTPQNPMGAIKKLSGSDICDDNLNYAFSMAVDNILYLEDSVVYSSEVQSSPTKWGVNGNGEYFVQPAPSEEGGNVIPIGWSRWIPQSIWFESYPVLARLIDTFSEQWSLKDAIPLWSAIDVLLKKIDPSITFAGTSAYSGFLYGTISSSVITNWVSQLWYITPITNVKKTYYNQAARKATITLEDIFNLLRCFQLYWFIDSQNRLRIEHITWFRNGGNYAQSTPLVDLTSIVSPMSMKPWGFNVNTIEYGKSELINRYEFGWNDKCSDIFNGFPIDIKDAFNSKGKTEKASAGNFISDIDLIISTPNAISDDCFALIGTNASRECQIANIGNLGMDFVCPTYSIQNAYMSFFFIEFAYWIYNMGGLNARVSDYKRSNGKDGLVVVKGTQRVKKQSVTFPLSPSNVGKEGLIKTSIGNGEWVKEKYNIESGIAEADLIHGIDFSLYDFNGFTTNQPSIGIYEKIDDEISVSLYGFVQQQGEIVYAYIKILPNKNIDIESVYVLEEDATGYISYEPITTMDDLSKAIVTFTGESHREDAYGIGDEMYLGIIFEALHTDLADGTITFTITEH